MKDIQILKDELIGKGILDKEAFNGRRKDILESLKPRNFLTASKLHEIQKALGSLKLPKPIGWAHALYIQATKEVIDDYSPDRSYCRCCLINLRATLHEAGLRNDNVFRKLTIAIRTAETYGVESCLFSGD